MITSAVAVKVGAAPEVVFRFLLDPKNLERTVPSNLNVEIKRGDFSGPSSLMHWKLTKKDGSKVDVYGVGLRAVSDISKGGAPLFDVLIKLRR